MQNQNQFPNINLTHLQYNNNQNQSQFQMNRLSVKLTKEERGYFSNLFQMLVKEGELKIEGKEGANFLKKSGLPKETLKNIWTISAQTNLSWLERDEFYVALRLIALAQNSLPVDSQSIIINEPIPPLPKFDLKDKEDWEISSEMLNQYTIAYETYRDKSNNLVNFKNANEIFLFYKAKTENLHRIYEIISLKFPSEGFTKNEIIVIMHLLNKLNNNYLIPNRLPDNLRKYLEENNNQQNINVLSSNVFDNLNQLGSNSSKIDFINNNFQSSTNTNTNTNIKQPAQSLIINDIPYSTSQHPTVNGNNITISNNNDITNVSSGLNSILYDNNKISTIVNTQLNNCISFKKDEVNYLQSTLDLEKEVYNKIKSQIDVYINEGLDLDNQISNLKRQIQDVRKDINISIDKLKINVSENNKKYKEVIGLTSKFKSYII